MKNHSELVETWVVQGVGEDRVRVEHKWPQGEEWAGKATLLETRDGVATLDIYEETGDEEIGFNLFVAQLADGRWGIGVASVPGSKGFPEDTKWSCMHRRSREDAASPEVSIISPVGARLRHVVEDD